MTPIKYFSMFSGIGGFEYGMELSDYEFENVGFSEIDDYAKSIYQRHYPKHINYGDATKIRTEELEDFDLLVGGFPCQSFSIANTGRQGLGDTRGTLFFEIARVLKDKRPKYFLLENVRNLLHHDKGRTFKTIIGVFSEVGYDVQWKIYNSRNHGVCQNRERIFIVGIHRSERSRRKVLLLPRNYEKEVDGKLDGFWWNVTDDLKVTTTAKGDVFALVGHEPCRPFWKKAGTYIQDNIGLRKLTACEREMLQGFPKGWTSLGAFGEEISNAQRFKCLGNAVTTFVVRDIINEVFNEEFDE